MHAKVIRPCSHSLSDDERLYKTPEERKAEALRDPLPKMRAFLLHEQIATEADLEGILQSVDRGIAESTELAQGAQALGRFGRVVRVLANSRSHVDAVPDDGAARASRTPWSGRSIGR